MVKHLYIVDASVAVKWYVPEIYSEAAKRLQNPDYQLQVRKFFLLEFGNVVCKKLRRRDITVEFSELMITDV
jgi:predicted nucleic acid-binding protein